MFHEMGRAGSAVRRDSWFPQLGFRSDISSRPETFRVTRRVVASQLRGVDVP
jgi:hypothetical protein